MKIFSKQRDYRINLRHYRIIYFPLLLPVALLLWLFNKLSPVPFKIYLHRVERVGQMAGNLEEYLCELDLGMHPKEFRSLVHRDVPSNTALLNMQKRAIPIRQYLLPLFDVCNKLGGLGVVSLDLARTRGQDPQQLVTRCQRHLYFTPEEIAEARRQCREVGIDPDVPFVSVLGRDNSFLAHIKEPTDMDSYRNVDINTFIPAMEFLAAEHQVLRLGSVVKDRLCTEHPMIIDYSLSGKRSELLDVYLSAQCRFFMSVGTGLDSIAAMCFRLPVLYVNYIPANNAPIMKPGAVTIFKKYWLVKEERYLTMSELLKTGIGALMTPATLNPFGVEVHDNTPEEILDATKEMVARLDGTWQDTADDIVRQEQFWSHFTHIDKEIRQGLRIGSSFLKSNPYWLE